MSHRWLIIGAALLDTGCGTNSNLRGSSFPLYGGEQPTTPFGGVKRDIGWIASGMPPPVKLIFVADLPFSVVGDVLTLPETLAPQPPIEHKPKPAPEPSVADEEPSLSTPITADTPTSTAQSSPS